MSGFGGGDVTTLTSAIELVAAGSWAVEHALRCLAKGDVERAAQVLDNGRSVVREGLESLRDVLDAAMHDEFERPERLARALESLQELRELQLEPLAISVEG